MEASGLLSFSRSMSAAQIRVLEDKIRDLERILRATEAIYEAEKIPARKTELAKELGALEYEIDRLREKIEALKWI